MPDRPAVPAPSAKSAYEPRGGERCATCGHEFKYHALGVSECVRYVDHHRCTCREFARREARDE